MSWEEVLVWICLFVVTADGRKHVACEWSFEKISPDDWKRQMNRVAMSKILVLIQHKKSSKIAEIMDPAAVHLHLRLLLEPLPFEAVFCIRRLSDAYIGLNCLMSTQVSSWFQTTNNVMPILRIKRRLSWEQHIVFPI
jgi:hypothetical protein